MKRKTFIKRLTLGSSGAVMLPAMGILQSCELKPQLRTAVTEVEIPYLEEIGETIIPTTPSSPGAKATNIGKYMLLMYTDCMPLEEQEIFLKGLNDLDARCSKRFKVPFVNAEATQKLELLEILQTEATAYNLKMEDAEKSLPHYFDLFKNLTISGYFSSEIGMTQARKYLPVPGKFEACTPYSHGDKPWAT